MLEEGMRPGEVGEYGLQRELFQDLEQDRNLIISKATTGDWEKVLEILSQDRGSSSISCLLPMNYSKDTVLHLAASDGQTEVVAPVLRSMMISDHDQYQYLGDESGNTPLHLAVANRHFDTCRRIVEIAPHLALARNVEGETPIYVAALNGFTHIFSTLDSKFPQTALIRRNSGDTILHCAISGDYFDLASYIIERYNHLINYRNERGITPFHLLANNSSAFRSGCRLGPLDYLFYSSQMLRMRVVKSRERETLDQNASTDTCLKLLFKYLLNAFLVIFAIFGFSCRINKMRREKQKHRWAYRVLKQLLKSVPRCTFGEINAGINPNKLLLERMVGTNIRIMLQPGQTACAPLSEEIDWGIYTNSRQESQQMLPGGPQPHHVPSSSSIPQTYSHMNSLTTSTSSNPPKEVTDLGLIESPFLIAGKKGVIEIVEEILTLFPMAIYDMDKEHKNIMMLAVEYRQPDIYMFMKNRKSKSKSWFGKVDVEGNSILHLAAKYQNNQPLLIPGAALQMQREIKWYKFVKKSMPSHFHKRQNHKGQTAMELFTDTHQDLAKERAKWLGSAAQSCSVVATLITTVAFATIATVPGGLVQEHGAPVLQGKPAFNIFTVSSLFALCFSAISLIMFLGILTSPYQDLDFGNDLPKKLSYGLISFFISIAAMFLSFFSGDLFVLESKIKYLAYPIFIVTASVGLIGFPLYYDFIMEMVRSVPKRTYPHELSI